MASPPTPEEVLRAVRGYFADDPERSEARAALARWGPRALVALRRLAEEDGPRALDGSLHWALVCAVGEADTLEALELLVDVLDGRTRVEAQHALVLIHARVGFEPLGQEPDPAARRTLRTSPHYRALERRRRHLAEHERFRRAARRFAKHPSWYLRKLFCGLAASLCWADAAPTVRAMLTDVHLDLRVEASAALAALTGEVVDVVRPPASFPSAAPTPGLLGKPRALPLAKPEPNLASPVACFTTWLDGRPALIAGRERELTVRGAGFRARARLKLDRVAHRLLGLAGPGGRRRQVVLLADGELGPAEYAVCIDERGERLWLYRPPGAGIRDCVPLYGPHGESGLAFALAGNIGAVAVDLDGERLWTRAAPRPVYALSTHAALPERMLVVCGGVELVDPARPTPVRLVLRGARPGPGDPLHADRGRLFPAEDGTAAALVAGAELETGNPVLQRLDADLEEVWRATLPHRVTGLALLEPEGLPRLFAAATAGGELFLFDADGRLLRRQPLPAPPFAVAVRDYSVEAGENAPGDWAVCVRLLGAGPVVYPLLPRRPAA